MTHRPSIHSCVKSKHTKHKLDHTIHMLTHTQSHNQEFMNNTRHHDTNTRQQVRSIEHPVQSNNTHHQMAWQNTCNSNVECNTISKRREKTTLNVSNQYPTQPTDISKNATRSSEHTTSPTSNDTANYNCNASKRLHKCAQT